MHYREFVRKAYQEAVRLHPTAHQDLKDSLKTNSMVPRFVDDVAVEVQKVQDSFLKKNIPILDDMAIKGLVYDLTNMFINNIEKRKEEAYMSEAQKMLIKQKQDYQRDLEMMGGDFADIIREGGVKFTEERDGEEKA